MISYKMYIFQFELATRRPSGIWQIRVCSYHAAHQLKKLKANLCPPDESNKNQKKTQTQTNKLTKQSTRNPEKRTSALDSAPLSRSRNINKKFHTPRRLDFKTKLDSMRFNRSGDARLVLIRLTRRSGRRPAAARGWGTRAAS